MFHADNVYVHLYGNQQLYVVPISKCVQEYNSKQFDSIWLFILKETCVSIFEFLWNTPALAKLTD